MAYFYAIAASEGILFSACALPGVGLFVRLFICSGFCSDVLGENSLTTNSTPKLLKFIEWIQLNSQLTVLQIYCISIVKFCLFALSFLSRRWGGVLGVKHPEITYFKTMTYRISGL